MSNGKKSDGVIDTTQPWKMLVPVLLHFMANGNESEKKFALDEINKMAHAADSFEQLQKGEIRGDDTYVIVYYEKYGDPVFGEGGLQDHIVGYDSVTQDFYFTTKNDWENDTQDFENMRNVRVVAEFSKQQLSAVFNQVLDTIEFK